jgi:Transglutaminase-like superfamily
MNRGSRERVAFALEVLGIYARVRWLLLRRGTAPAVGILRRGLRAHDASASESARVSLGLRSGRAVVRVLRLLPTDSRCLMRSLVLTRMLARRGVYATVVIGVRPGHSFAAHAWVEVDGHPVLATDESEYHRLVEL